MQMAPVAMEAAWTFHLKAFHISQWPTVKCRQLAAAEVHCILTSTSVAKQQLSPCLCFFFYMSNHRGKDTRPPESNVKLIMSPWPKEKQHAIAQREEGGHTIGVIKGAAGFSEASRDAAAECTDRTRPLLPGESEARQNIRRK